MDIYIAALVLSGAPVKPVVCIYILELIPCWVFIRNDGLCARHSCGKGDYVSSAGALL